MALVYHLSEVKFSFIRIIPTSQDYCETGLVSLLTQVHGVKAMVFPVVMYGCESWTIKKAEHQVTDAFSLLEKALESPLGSKEIKPVNPKGNQS